ncbi:MAG TPA: DUF2934 domain-containing protein [Povalibacter sp.]
MQLSSDSPSPGKRSRAKPKSDSGAVVAPKKPRASKKATSAEPPVEVIALTPSPDELTGMIATTAYFIAAERNFLPGHELDDWLEAERQVRDQYPV